MSEQLLAEERARFLWKLWDESPALQGRDEWVGHIATSIKAAERQARAEVLAACAEHVYKHLAKRSAEATGGKFNNPALAAEMSGLAIGLKAEILALQPAAAALEALLREAELKGIKSAHAPGHVCSSGCPVLNRIAELEQARAILGRSK